MLTQLEEYAKINNVPIMNKEGITYLINIIKENNIKTILEIGSAIGYSAINMALINENINILTIERDKKMFDLAVNNINNFNLNKRITIINKDALDNLFINSTFDLIFIDAAKSKSIVFFNMYKDLLNKNGLIITDNINFHGLTINIDNIKNKRTRSLMKKIIQYKEFLITNEEFITEFINVGDGISVSKRK